MTIEATCPNGHRIACPDERAGTSAKCPKCGGEFSIPALPAATASGSSPRIEQGPNNTITFLCPSGHRLNGPASLQGKPGQCPHCGTKFRIPFLEEETAPVEDESPPAESEPEVEEIEEFEEIEEAEEAESPAEPFEEAEPIGEFEGVEEVNIFDSLPGAPAIPFAPSSSGDAHALAKLFTLLWDEREHGAIIEVHLEDNQIVLPDWWAKDLSMADYCVFALQAADGSYSMETIPWASVRRVSVRQIKALPDGVFQ